ncbi:N-acetylgalactosamine-6-sulfatase [Thalassotalea sp. HSM 43]|nr:N-acetylgalactosamine-6-sulfatase [Thalassotalea sp. HSM 43]
MADDLGYGDTGFNGNTIIQTPNLDQMAKEGVKFSHFYSASSVCSPTRGSFLTGRHPHRYGIFWANVGHLPKEEITLAEILKEQGYATGHFGKWHLGTLSKQFSSKGKKRKPDVNYSPPAWHGYDVSFVTESAVALWDPAKGQRAKNNPFWLDGKALEPSDAQLQGGASRVVMDQVLPFIEQSVKANQPFAAIVWFHAPHMDVVAGPKYLEKYQNYGEAAHYYGVVTEMDEQIGRLRKALKKLGVERNTLLTFTSDNGPEGKTKNSNGRTAGVTGGLRGRKRDLFEGGVRVPTLAVWPKHITAGTTVSLPSSTLDYFPTVAEIVGYSMPDSRPIDGISLLPLLINNKSQPNFKRHKAIPFIAKEKASLIDGGYKLVTSVKNNNKFELYDLVKDPSETSDVASQYPELVAKMSQQIKAFLASAKASHSGADYHDKNYHPVVGWPINQAKKRLTSDE